MTSHPSATPRPPVDPAELQRELQAEVERLRESVAYLEARVDRADDATARAMDERDEARRDADRERAERLRWTGIAADYARELAEARQEIERLTEEDRKWDEGYMSLDATLQRVSAELAQEREAHRQTREAIARVEALIEAAEISERRGRTER